MTISTLILIFFLHWIADFILQSDWMARNKSSSNKALALHAAVYSIPFLIIGFWYAVVNGILHSLVDYFTSRESSKRWQSGEVHNFFVVVGLDQFIHMCTLVVTYYILF